MTISTVEKSGMIWGCENTDVCGTRIASLAFRPRSTIRGIFGDPKARIVYLDRRGKKRFAQSAVISSEGGTIANGAGFGIWRAGIIGSTWRSRCAESIAGGA